MAKKDELNFDNENKAASSEKLKALQAAMDKIEKSFGKGVYELMKKAQSFGSLSGAYKDMKMSNSKAWKILKRAEEDLDMPLVERISGGKDGGGSKLTQEGEELLEKYEKFIQEMNEYAKIRFKEIFEDE